MQTKYNNIQYHFYSLSPIKYFIDYSRLCFDYASTIPASIHFFASCSASLWAVASSTSYVCVRSEVSSEGRSVYNVAPKVGRTLVHTDDIAEIDVFLAFGYDDALTAYFSEVESFFCFHCCWLYLLFCFVSLFALQWLEHLEPYPSIEGEQIAS